ncbi:hypothetical protein PpBr36_00193 [Pyricularia pennisetigena]|uniref:hypothetical protein n=1 Tax=Pyricularia pennisetigena TaxID=1578925 RepID=UPI001150261F|nr:hypothetical protein PpBr36_00193 [Pyricularia pennisetigena]TLS28367.1 hypothetical protein PpBr36_00193 [Pyricularia pennisetigena]
MTEKSPSSAQTGQPQQQRQLQNPLPNSTQPQQRPQERPRSPPPPPTSPISPSTRLPPDIAPAVPVPTATGSSTRYTAVPSPSAVSFFAANRPALTHLSQPDQNAPPTQASTSSQAQPPLDAPPPPRPLDFDTNPDVLAIKSAISILQIQRARAQADMAALGRARDAAMREPLAFVEDLRTGRVATAPEAPTLFDPFAPLGEDEDDDSSSDEDAATADASATKGKQPAGASSKPASQRGKDPSPPWRNLPRPQNVVRCPPINWSQYAVVGESLDKLHNEQVARPNPGAPAVMGSGGVYEFKGGSPSQPVGPGPRFVGVAAPYDPQRDKLEKKPRKPKGAAV